MSGRMLVKAGKKVEAPVPLERAKKTLLLPLDVAAALKAHCARELGKGIRVTETDVIVAALSEWLDARRGKK